MMAAVLVDLNRVSKVEKPLITEGIIPTGYTKFEHERLDTESIKATVQRFFKRRAQARGQDCGYTDRPLKVNRLFRVYADVLKWNETGDESVVSHTEICEAYQRGKDTIYVFTYAYANRGFSDLRHWDQKTEIYADVDYMTFVDTWEGK